MGKKDRKRIKEITFYDAFLMFALISAVASDNSPAAMIMLAIASVLELADVVKNLLKVVRYAR